MGEEAAMWLSAVIGRRCRLWRQDPQDQRKAKRQPNESKDVCGVLDCYGCGCVCMCVWGVY